MVDKRTVQQLLGSLMKKPQLLSQVDKYSFVLTDFPSRFEKYIYSAIEGLYRNGATNIQSIDVENFLSTNQAAAVVFKEKKGIEYLQDIIELSEVENFDYYYGKFKKLNLLKDLKRSGFDISEYYCEDLTNPKAQEINGAFEFLTTKDITDGVRKKLLGLESKYEVNDEVEIQSAAAGIEDFVEQLGAAYEIGIPIQGAIYNQVIDGAKKGTLTIRSAASGVGKALPNSTVIPTPDGKRKVSDIKVGDYLFDAFGKPTKVLGVYPQGRKEVLYVRFKDGRVAQCCEDHLWSYCTRGQKEYSKKERKFYTKTLKEIRQQPLQDSRGAYNILVPMNYAVEYEEQYYYIPPYIMGLALGDGSFRQNESNKAFQFSSEDEFLPNYIGLMMNWEVRKNNANFGWYFSFNNKAPHKNVWVQDFLKQYPELLNTKSETKFIPEEYLYGSVEQRFDLLSGLLDTDGSVDSKGRISYYTISPLLRDNIVELCHSLGFKTTVLADNHKDTNIGFIIRITGRPEDKVKLFKLPRKKEIIQTWYNSNTRKESNEFNPIIEIGSCGYTEEMTCFMVDNEEHLFLTEDYIVTHNTRNAVADACYLAYPFRYNSTTCEWEQEGNSEKVLFIVTEQRFKEVRTMILAYLTDINAVRFKYADFSDRERAVITQAIHLMEKYSDNLILVKMPNPTIELVKTIVRENCITHDIGYVFYDYIFIGPSLLNEFKGFALRNDEVLLMFATALKDLAVELDVAMFTATQLNANGDDNKNIINEGSLAGGRSTINKADNGAIMARPTKEELEILEPLYENRPDKKPNLVTDIFKVRSGEWTQVRIWSDMNLGTLRKKDLFITDSRLDPIEDFFERDDYKITSWDEHEDEHLKVILGRLNEGEIID